MRHLLNLLALSALAMPGPTRRERSDPDTRSGPIVNYDRAAIRREEEQRRKSKHAAKLARREAQKLRNSTPRY
jgi:hypothetical protein